MKKPLAEQARPTKYLSDIIGQPHLTGANGIITNMLQNDSLKSMIFYGPPGTGKTSTARIIAENTNYPLCSLNATVASVKDIHKAITDNEDNLPVLVYLDEVQYFNKKQQQSLLPFIESGEMVLIASTTENPYHALYDALISRCIVCEFKKPTSNQIEERLFIIVRDFMTNKIQFGAGALHYIADISGGDVRQAISITELAYDQYKNRYAVHKTAISINDIKALLPSVNMAGFDTNENVHYGLISALQKSIRGSDPDAAVFYLARLLEGGDLLSQCRRLLVIANEDIGLAAPHVPSAVYAMVQTAKELGLPEAKLPLTNAVLLMATAPKSHSAEQTYNAALEDVVKGKGGTIPTHLARACAQGYLYPHDYPNHWVKQQYMPDDIIGHKYYNPENSFVEKQNDIYWRAIKS